MKTSVSCLALLALVSGCCESRNLQQRLAELHTQYAGNRSIVEIGFGPKVDVIALVVVKTVDSQVRQIGDLQGWACSVLEIEEILKGEVEGKALNVNCAYSIYCPDLEFGTLSDRRSKRFSVDAKEGDRLLVFLNEDDWLTAETGGPVYHAKTIYRMKTEPNKAVERSRLLVTDHAFACSAPSNRLAHLGR